MSRPAFAVLMAVFALIILLGMWLGWRARSKRDADVAPRNHMLSGEVLMSNEKRVMYVSTNPLGAPLTRVSAPGLKYRGFAQITVYSDGVTLHIQGEDPLNFSSEELAGAVPASRRVGKAVEQDGLALMQWITDTRVLESSFRFDTRSEQDLFVDAVNTIAASKHDHLSASHTAIPTAPSQEDEK